MKYVLAILGFSLLIIVHELGHFIMAKINKVKVLDFSIGMGPTIFSYKGKETTYSLRLLPVGGMVMLLNGEDNIDDPGCMLNKSHIRRISIIIAGIVMNFLLAIALFTGYHMSTGLVTKQIAEVTDNGAAKKAGVMPGDDIIRIDGKETKTREDVSSSIANAKDNPITMTCLRDGEEVTTNITPKYDDEVGSYMIGIVFDVDENPGILSCVKYSLTETKSLVTQTLSVVKNLVTGKGNFKTDLGGPVSVVRLSADVASNGIAIFAYYIGLLSISLAVFNALPFPMLDGGTALIYLIEMITRKKVPEKILTGINAFGFIALMALMIAVTIKDILFPMSF